MRKLKSIVSIATISVALIHCQTNEVDPDQYVAIDCVSEAPGLVSIRFNEGLTLSQAQSYGMENSDGIASLSSWFQTGIPEDDIDFINAYLRGSKYSDDGIYIRAYWDFSINKVVIDLDVYNLDTNISKLEGIILEWVELSNDPIIKFENYSHAMVLMVKTGKEKAWLDIHNNDSQLTRAERCYRRSSCE